MACMFLYPEKRSLTNDIMSGNPNKKIRLSFQKKNGGSAENEDLWGQDDLTAEEFDMLEIQATQSCNQSVNYQNNDAHHKVNCGGQQSTEQVDDLKQLQYELEGRVKLLSQSLERSSKELSEERLNREKMIKDRMQEFFQRESNLKKEVDKMQSILEFKEQEMKSVYSKVEVLKSQMQVKKHSTNTETFVHKNFDDFLKSSKSVVGHSNTSFTNKFHRRHKLFVDTPKGEPESIDILSSMLCSRLAVSCFLSSENFISTNIEDALSNFQLTPLSVVQLKTEQNCSELLEYYKYLLNRHVVHLKSSSSKSSAISSTKTSPISVKRKEAGSSPTVISCLKDIVYLLSCQRLDINAKKCDNIQSSTTFNRLINGQSTSSAEPVPMEDNVNNLADNHLTQILESLLALADPSTFPSGYPKIEEVELSLLALLTICLSYPEMFLDRVSALPIHSLSSPDCSVISVCTTLKLITTLSVCRNFSSHLTHKNSNCLLCSLASFLCNTICHSLEKFSVSMILVEDFLSTLLSVHNFSSGIQLETSPCISELVQGVIASLWKFFQQRDQISCSSLIINKGFFLLLHMSNHIPNFKEKRSRIEDKYISLISSLLTLSKENAEFRELYDLINILWDFQTDVSEFDLDEQSDETQASSNEMDNAE